MAYLAMIDDDEDFALAAATVLRSEGHEVDILLEAEGAAEKIAARPPDLVILDVMFPEDPSAGFKVARAIRRSDALEGVPVLLLTAVNSEFPLGFSNNDIDPEWLPVTEFLEKPVDLDVLKSRVASRLIS